MSSNKRQMEMESAEVLLDFGISIPILQVRVPFTQRRWTHNATMRRPTMASLMRIGRLYRAMGVDVAELKSMDKMQQYELLANHGDKIAEIVMVAILRDDVRIWLWGRMLKWLLMNHCSDRHLAELNQTFAPLYGTRAFEIIIASVEAANPLAPRASH